MIKVKFDIRFVTFVLISQNNFFIISDAISELGRELLILPFYVALTAQNYDERFFNGITIVSTNIKEIVFPYFATLFKVSHYLLTLKQLV